MSERKKTSFLSRRAFLAGAAAAGITAALPLSPAFAARGGYQQTALLMGTIVRIDIAGAPQSAAEDAAAAAFARARALEGVLTRFDSSAPLGVLNAQGSLADMPGELRDLLNQSGEIYRLTKGSFDPSILPVLQGLQRGGTEGGRLSKAELAELFGLVDYSRVRMDSGVRLESGMALTLDGIAKGRIAQEMSRELDRLGCPNHIVNAGGDIIARGCPERGGVWRIGVRSPFDAGSMETVVPLTDRALATSGVYEQPLKGGGGSHLVVPANFESRPEAVSASVLARDGALADALATAFSVMSPAAAAKACRRMDGVECMLVLRSGAVVKSEGWPA
ncbi:MAG: FAD:protein FMN transferase [Desulfovibrionaceae bacterium]|nr:FAD:protein FMN transferase [Desulfovibrionaceae bacterium]